MTCPARPVVAIVVACGPLALSLTLAQDPAPPAPARAVEAVKVEIKPAAAGDQAETKAEVRNVEVKTIVVVEKAAVAAPDLNPLIQQFAPQFRPLLRSEAHFLRTICEPTEAQRKALARDGDRVLKDAARQYAEMQQKLMRGQWRGNTQPDPRKLIQQGMLAAARAHLTPEQVARYQAEVDRRTEDRKRAAIGLLVAKLDQDLVLTVEQRDKLAEALAQNWSDAWGGALEMYANGNDQYFPMIPEKVVGPLLNKTQKRIWDGSPKTQMNVFFGANFGGMGGLEIEDELPDEPAAGQAPKAETIRDTPKVQEPKS